MIKVSKLEKYFNKGKKNELHVLNDIHVEFDNKGLVCILGESGSGKTTLLNTIGGLDTFHSGKMEVDGAVVKRYDPKVIEQLRNDKFGYIFQNYYLLLDYTVAYNVKLALNTFDISEEEKDERVEYVLEKLDILKYKKKLVSQLSGGQQQRVSIARALVKSPKIILADEPTGNLDEENTLRTMSILKSISKECLVILVSHEKRIAHFFADRIIEIQDGKIIKDYKNKNQTSYERMDDGNIYLKDLEQISLQGNEQFSANIFQESGEENEKIELNFAWKNGKLYIQNMADYDILFEGAEAGCEMLDMEKPDVKMETIEEFEFSLPRLKNHKTAKLSPKEIWKLALENIRLMGKKQAFITGILVITAVLLTITVANFTNSFFFNKHEVYKTDSHYVTVNTSPQSGVHDYEYTEALQKFCDKNTFAGNHTDVFKTNGGELSLKCDDYMQLAASGVNFEDFSYVSLSHVSKKDLIYGRMPQKRNEIVVDRWLFDKFLSTNNTYKILYPDVESFLNTTLLAKVTSDEFNVVGIADTGEPSIYLDQNLALGLSINSYRIATIEQLQQNYPKDFENLALKDDEVLVSESDYVDYKRRKAETITMENNRKYKIVGTFPDGFSVKFILNSASCQQIRNDYIVATRSYDLYTNDAHKAIDDLKEAAGEYSNIFQLRAYSDSERQLAKFEKAREDNVSGRNLIVIAAVVVSLFIIYFTIKSNVVSRTEELTVYRLIGIAKSSITKAYLLEMALITSYTVLPAVLATSIVIKFIGSIPSLELGLTFPWWSAGALIVVMYLLNLFISMVPVRSILSKPPAVLALKE